MVEAGDFSRTLRDGGRAGGRFLVVAIAVPRVGTAILHAPEPVALPVKVGFITAKRQLPRAVDRGRVKRQLRHLMRDRLDQFPPGSTVVIRVLASAKGRSSKELAKSLDQALAGGLASAKRKAEKEAGVSS